VLGSQYIRGRGICHFPLTITEESLAVREEYMCIHPFLREPIFGIDFAIFIILKNISLKYMDISISYQKGILYYCLTSYSIVFYNSINLEYNFLNQTIIRILITIN